MTTPDKLLVTLLDAPRSASSLGAALHIPELVAKANCERHRANGLIDIAGIADDGSTFYQLTPAGRQSAEALKGSQLAL